MMIKELSELVSLFGKDAVIAITVLALLVLGASIVLGVKMLCKYVWALYKEIRGARKTFNKHMTEVQKVMIDQTNEVVRSNTQMLEARRFLMAEVQILKDLFAQMKRDFNLLSDESKAALRAFEEKYEVIIKGFEIRMDDFGRIIHLKTEESLTLVNRKDELLLKAGNTIKALQDELAKLKGAQK